MDQRTAYLRVTHKDLNRLMKLIERDEKTRVANRVRQAKLRGVDAPTHSYVQQVAVEVLNLPSEIEEILRDYGPADEEAQSDSLNEQA